MSACRGEGSSMTWRMTARRRAWWLPGRGGSACYAPMMVVFVVVALWVGF